MVGVNQVIMLSLNMVIIASMIGAGGLGFDVLTALRRLDIGGGLEAGLAIVVLAIALDRLSQAYALAAARHGAMSADRSLHHRALLRVHRGRLCPRAVRYARGADLSDVAAALDRAVLGRGGRWINVNFFDTFEAIKTRAAAQRAHAGQAVHGRPALALGRGRARLRRLALGGCALAASRRRAHAASSRSPANGRRRW